MEGKKYRGVPIKLWSSMLTGMGAVATPVEVSELATALATGLVIGQENPLPISTTSSCTRCRST